MAERKKYRARVKLDKGYAEAVIEAKGQHDAKKLLEAQYGKGNVGNLHEVH